MKLESIASASQRGTGSAACAAITAMTAFPPRVQAAAIASMFLLVHRQTKISVSDLLSVAQNKTSAGIVDKVAEIRGAALAINQEIAQKD